MDAHKMRSVATALSALRPFNDFEKENGLELDPQSQDIVAMREHALIKAIHNSLVTGGSVEWTSDPDGPRHLMESVESVKPLIQSLKDKGIEFTQSQPIHAWSESQDKRSGGETWVLYLTAVKKT